MSTEWFMYVDPIGNTSEPCYHIISRAGILADYWERWADIAKLHKEDVRYNNRDFFEQKCIDDFCAINWATPVNYETLIGIFLDG